MITPTPKSLWRRKDAPIEEAGEIEVARVEVVFFPKGGGFQMRLPADEFFDRYQVSKREDWEDVFPIPAIFCFDDGPSFVGFTHGQRWNGWGMPCCEVSVFKQWWDALIEETGEGDCGFRFLEDGTLIYDQSAYYPEDEYEHEVFPVSELDYRGKIYQVYQLGGSLCWNEYPYAPETLDAMEDNDEKLIPTPGIELPKR